MRDMNISISYKKNIKSHKKVLCQKHALRKYFFTQNLQLKKTLNFIKIYLSVIKYIVLNFVWF